MIKQSGFKIVLLVLAVALSPRIPIGAISGATDGAIRLVELRVEDILLSIFLFLSAATFLVSGRAGFRKPAFFTIIAFWLAVGLFSLLINLILGNITFSFGFLYFLKEIEFYLFFFFIYLSVNEINFVKRLINLWMFLGLVNVSWVAYIFLSKSKISQYYGPNIFIESNGPFPSGGFFLMVFIFLSNLFIFYFLNGKASIVKKITLAFLCISPAVGVISSGSRASIVGLIVSVLISLLLFVIKMRKLKKFIKLISLLAFIVLIVLTSANLLKINFQFRLPTPESILWEYSSTEEASRLGILLHNLETLKSHPFYLLFGFGVKGEMHSQYMRVLMERGILGFVLFIFLIANILIRVYKGFILGKSELSVGLCAGALAATIALLVISVPNDAFMIVKVAEVYWFFIAITLAVLDLVKEEKI